MQLEEIHVDVFAFTNDVSSNVNTTNNISTTMKSLSEQGYVSKFASVSESTNNTPEVTSMSNSNNGYDNDGLPPVAAAGTMKAKMEAKKAAAAATAAAAPVPAPVPAQTTNTTEVTPMQSLQSQGFVSMSAPASAPAISTPVVSDAIELVKAELIVNITMSDNNMLSKATIASAKSKQANKIIGTRSAGSILFNKNDDSVYAEFAPLPEVMVDAYGNNNAAVWRLTYSNGTVAVLSPNESINFWTKTLASQTGGVVATDLGFFVKCNIAESRTTVEDYIENTAARAYVIEFTNVDSMFTFSPCPYRESMRLIPNQATVKFLSKTVQPTQPTIGVGRNTPLESLRAGASVAAINFQSWLRSPSKKTQAAIAAEARVRKQSTDNVVWTTEPVQVQAAKASISVVADTVVPEVAEIDEVAEVAVVDATEEVATAATPAPSQEATQEVDNDPYGFNKPAFVYVADDEDNIYD